MLKAIHWRGLFYNNVAYILGWQKRRNFPNLLLYGVRKIWLDEQSNIGEGGYVLGSTNPIARAGS